MYPMTFDLLGNVPTRHINIPQLIISSSSIRRAGTHPPPFKVNNKISVIHIYTINEITCKFYSILLSIYIQNDDILIEIYLNIDT
jgi:hypothetical protein